MKVFRYPKDMKITIGDNLFGEKVYLDPYDNKCHPLSELTEKLNFYDEICDYCRKPLEVNSYDHCVHCGAPSENFDNDALYERMTREFSHAD
jgi:uncharacterized CHY-type Zn-finger protein